MSKGQDTNIPSPHACAPFYFGFFGSFRGRYVNWRAGE